MNKNIKQNTSQEQVTHSTFINYLPLQEDKSIDIMWKYNNTETFNKFTQFPKINININKELQTLNDNTAKNSSLKLPKIQNDTIIIDKEILQESIKNCVEIESKIIDEVKNDTKKKCTKKEVKEVVKEVKEVNEVNEVVKKVVKEVKEAAVKDMKKCENLSPLEFIMEHCSVNIISKDYIKQKLIETISRKDYNKIFGLKKSSEIMTGITKDRWNKSLALFMSFLSDKEILYKGVIIKYNNVK